MSHTAGTFLIPPRFNIAGNIALSTGSNRNNEHISDRIVLEGDEGIIVKTESTK
jgi:hypothetical protein